MGRDDFVSAGCPVLTIGCLTDAGINLNKAVYIRPDKAAELDRYRLRTGDLLFSRMASVGRAGMVPPELDGALFNYHIMRLRLAENLMLPELFLSYVRGAPAVQKYLEDVNHGATRDGINTSQLVEMPVTIPPLNEQRRIIAKIEELTVRSRRAREALDTVPRLLDQLRQSILAAAFRGDLTADWREQNSDVESAEELLVRIRAERRRIWEETEFAKLDTKGKRPIDDRWKQKYQGPERLDAGQLAPLPQGWAWASWQEIGMSQNGRPFSSSEYQTSGVRLLRPGNLHVSGVVKWTPENTRCLPERFAEENPDLLIGPNEIIMNLTAQSLKDQFLGRVCVSGPGERSLLNQRLARLTPIILSPRFVMWMFKSPIVRAYIDELNSGSLIQHMFTSQVEGFALPIPPVAEQDEILSRLNIALERIDKIAFQVAEVSRQQSELAASILAKAFRGELVPQDPNDEPASALLERIHAGRGRAEFSEAESLLLSDEAKPFAKVVDRSDETRDDSPVPVVTTAIANYAPKNLSEVAPETLQNEVFAALWTHGPLEKDDATRRVAEHLRQVGYVEFQRLRADGPLYSQILDAIESAVKAGRLDRPKRGHVRACKSDATAYTADDWRHALVASLGTEAMERDEAIRVAAEWARDNLGLEFARLRSDGHIVEGLRSAINSAIRRGQVTRHGATHISRAAGSGQEEAGQQLSLRLGEPAGASQRSDARSTRRRPA